MSNSNINLQTQSSNALHNAIMEAGSKDRPPMLAPGNYVQWKSRIKRYIDTKPNSELIHYCLQNPPYMYQWAEKTVLVAEGSSETTTERYMENYKNVSQDIRDQLNAEAEAVQIILTGIDNDIYSTVDACPNACEMWKAIERLKQGESINVQDLETNLYWEFGKFTSRDGESLESYYSRFYKMMNELVRNQCHVTNHQVNVQFLLQLQPEWQRFVTLVKQSQELKTVSYHKLYDILKQHQNEVNEIRAERLARTANPLALVAQQQPVYHHQNYPTQNTQYSSTRSQQSTRNRGKEIVTSSAPTYDPEPDTVTEDDEMSKDKEIDKLMALISLLINRGTGYDNQRAVNVAGARENVGTPIVQKSGIQCYNYKEYGHVSRECQKPKRVKDAAYHKEKMLLCKQEEVGVQLNAEQADWKDDTDDESDDQELEAHYMYLAQLQEVTPDPVENSGSIFNDEPMHKVQNNNRNYNAFAMENEHPEQPESSNDIYMTEQGDTNITIDSLDICYDRARDDQDEIDDLDQEYLKKFQAELDKYNDVNYASKMEIDCAKAKGDLISQQSTRNRGKAIVTSYAPTYDPEPATVTEDDEISKDKDIDKLMTFNFSLRAVNVVGARENVGTLVVQKSGIQCYNCKEYGHVSRESDWKDDTDDEFEDHELEAYYMYMAQIQQITPDSPSSSVFKCRNFMKKFIGTVRFGNDHFGAIMGYEDYMIGDRCGRTRTQSILCRTILRL
ncbi:retrovirus-related pol polyprotein from transposon TNT 1-94 [Tanacetum coccineum]